MPGNNDETETAPTTWYFELGEYDEKTKGYPRAPGLFSSDADLDEYLKRHAGAGVVRSLYDYDSTNFETAKRRGDFPFDFDSEDGDLERVREEALAAVDALCSGLGLYTSQVKIFFSGNKGFHVLAPFEVFGTVPRSDLHLVYKAMFEGVRGAAHLKTADPVVYDARRLWRVPNTRHPISGLFKVPLTYEELKTLSVEGIRSLAKMPRSVDVMPVPGPHSAAEEKFKKYAALVEGKRKTPPEKAFDMRELPHYVREIVNGVAQGGRNQAAFKLAFYYHRLGLQQGKAQEKLAAWNALNRPPLAEGELKVVLASAYRYDVETLAGEEEEQFKQTCFFETEDGKTYQQVEGNRFVSWDGTEYAFVESFISNGVTFVPQENPLMKSKAPLVVLAEKPEPYGSVNELVTEVEAFSKKFVDISDDFRKLSAYFVLQTWVYDAFNTVPYLRFLGDTGTGKSRARDTFGYLCYNFIPASGAVSVAPVYRLIEAWGGTMGFDETDFKKSDATDELTKVINCGFERGRPVLRCNPNDPSKVEAFDAYGPKIFGMRLPFEDPATESRCLSEETKETTLDLPTELPADFHAQAMRLRNKLLDFRLRRKATLKPAADIDLPNGVEKRLRQLAFPLLSVMTDERDRENFFSFLKRYHEKLLEARANSTTGQVLEHLLTLSKEITDGIPYKRVAQAMDMRYPSLITRELKSLGFFAEPRRVTVMVEERIEDEHGTERKERVPHSQVQRCICCYEPVWKRLSARYPFDALKESVPDVLKPQSKKLAEFGESNGV